MEYKRDLYVLSLSECDKKREKEILENVFEFMRYFCCYFKHLFVYQNSTFFRYWNSRKSSKQENNIEQLQNY